MAPWQLELQAAVIAIGEVGQPFERDGQELLRLTLTDVLKGEAALGALTTGDSAPWFGCIPPEQVPKPSAWMPPGTRALIYLQRQNGGALSILSIGKSPGESYEARIRSFVAVRAMINTPEPDWVKILAQVPEGDPGLDELTFYALGWDATLPESRSPTVAS